MNTSELLSECSSNPGSDIYACVLSQIQQALQDESTIQQHLHPPPSPPLYNPNLYQSLNDECYPEDSVSQCGISRPNNLDNEDTIIIGRRRAYQMPPRPPPPSNDHQKKLLNDRLMAIQLKYLGPQALNALNDDEPSIMNQTLEQGTHHRQQHSNGDQSSSMTSDYPTALLLADTPVKELEDQNSYMVMGDDNETTSFLAMDQSMMNEHQSSLMTMAEEESGEGYSIATKEYFKRHQIL